MKSSRWYKPRFGFDIRINSEKPEKPRAKPKVVPCAIKGCGEPAEYKVPKRRENLEDRQWLCREHVRAHNAQWNFFEGMSAEEIAKYNVDALTGHRPTWPLGKRAAGFKMSKRSFHVEDGFAVFEEAAEPAPRPRTRILTKAQIDALHVMSLEETATLQEIKARYKELVKRFHPDANGGDRGTEERLKQVIKAYGHLRASGLV